MKPFPRLARALVAIALCAVPASTAAPAAADPSFAVCLPDGAACATLDAGLAPCDTPPCAEARPTVCAAVAGLADACTEFTPLGNIERAAVGTITITGGPTTPPSMTLTGVYDPAAGLFTCTLTGTLHTESTVRCVEEISSYDWYCGGWIVTATSTRVNNTNAQVAGQASCADVTAFPGTSNDQTLWTAFTSGNDTKQNTAFQLGWFVKRAITCQAWGYSAGPHPMGNYTVTCNEPGQRTESVVR